MEHDFPLDALPLWAVFLSTMALISMSMELGFRCGRWRHKRVALEQGAPVGGVVGAILGLLGFILAMTVGIGVSRFDMRFQALLDEVDAIGTTYLRSDFVAEPLRGDLKKTLREYLAVRLTAPTTSNLQGIISRSEEIHGELWGLTVSAVERSSNQVAAGLLTQSINQIIDVHTKRVIAATGARIPPSLWYVLYGVTVLGVGTLGYQAALVGSSRSPSIIGLVASLAAVLWLISDLDRPREGTLKISQKALFDLQRTMNRN